MCDSFEYLLTPSFNVSVNVYCNACIIVNNSAMFCCADVLTLQSPVGYYKLPRLNRYISAYICVELKIMTSLYYCVPLPLNGSLIYAHLSYRTGMLLCYERKLFYFRAKF